MRILLGNLVLAAGMLAGVTVQSAAPLHVYEKLELTFTATGSYANPYTEVDMWVDLDGPSFHKRCYGFWDGGQTFRVRITSTEPGVWRWVSGSNPADAGLSGKRGEFTSIPWTETEKQDNPNRRGFAQATPDGHALRYADGTPCFLIGDFFYPASTSRYKWRDGEESYPVDSPEVGFKDLVRLRKSQGGTLATTRRTNAARTVRPCTPVCSAAVWWEWPIRRRA
jgi:hypothetical protein